MKRFTITALACFCFSVTAIAEIKTEEIKYHVGDHEFTGYLAYDDAQAEKRPGVLVLHEWWGHNDYARHRAEMLAGLGYTALALDMYGTGKLAEHPDDAMSFMQALFSDFDQARQRFDAAFQQLTQHTTVDASKTAAIGYCMGGGLALAMARKGADLDGVVVFHGSLNAGAPQSPVSTSGIKGKVLVFQGGADPFIPPEQIQAFETEMKAAKVPYELKIYPGAKHSFTVPEADRLGKEFDRPLAYDPTADKDSWQRMEAFLTSIF